MKTMKETVLAGVAATLREQEQGQDYHLRAVVWQEVKDARLRAPVEREIQRQKKICRGRMKRRASTCLTLHERLLARYLAYSSFGGNTWDRNRGDMRRVIDYRPGIALVGVDGWIQYTRKYGTYVRMRGLVFAGGNFVRCSPRAENIGDALEGLKPAAVRRAEAAGKEVLRQGDVYFIPSRRENYSGIEGTRHQIRDGKAIHPEHGELALDGSYKAILQIPTRNSWRGGGRRGD